MTILPKTRMQEAISILWEGVCASVYMHNIYIYKGNGPSRDLIRINSKPHIVFEDRAITLRVFFLKKK